MTTTSGSVSRERTAADPTVRPAVALAVGAFAIGTDIHVVAGILGGLAADLGVTVGVAGLAATVFALGLAAGAPLLLGAGVAARPPRQVLVGALLLYALLTGLSALAPTLGVLLVTRALAALACSVYVPTAAAAVVAAVPEGRRGRALATILLGSSLGTVLGAPAGVLLAATLSWRAAFGLVGLLAAVAVIGLLRIGGLWGIPAHEPPIGRGRASADPPPRSLGQPRVVGLLAVTFLLLTASSSVYTYLSVLVMEPQRLALLVAVFGAAGLVGAWCGGAAADRYGGRRVVAGALVMSAVGFAVLPLVAATAAAVAVAAGWGLAAWAFVPAQQHRLLGLHAGPAPVLLALNTSAIHLGFAAGALLGGLVVDTGGPPWTVALACCAAALTLHAIHTRKDPT